MRGKERGLNVCRFSFLYFPKLQYAEIEHWYAKASTKRKEKLGRVIPKHVEKVEQRAFKEWPQPRRRESWSDSISRFDLFRLFAWLPFWQRKRSRSWRWGFSGRVDPSEALVQRSTSLSWWSDARHLFRFGNELFNSICSRIQRRRMFVLKCSFEKVKDTETLGRIKSRNH